MKRPSEQIADAVVREYTEAGWLGPVMSSAMLHKIVLRHLNEALRQEREQCVQYIESMGSHPLRRRIAAELRVAVFVNPPLSVEEDFRVRTTGDFPNVS